MLFDKLHVRNQYYFTKCTLNSRFYTNLFCNASGTLEVLQFSRAFQYNLDGSTPHPLHRHLQLQCLRFACLLCERFLCCFLWFLSNGFFPPVGWRAFWLLRVSEGRQRERCIFFFCKIYFLNLYFGQNKLCFYLNRTVFFFFGSFCLKDLCDSSSANLYWSLPKTKEQTSYQFPGKFRL